MEEWSKRRDGWSGEMEERGGMDEEEEWLGEVKRRDGWSGEMFEWENIEEGEEEEGRRGQEEGRLE